MTKSDNNNLFKSIKRF